jgi:hypothetical protein
MKWPPLKRQLRAGGASHDELDELAAVARQLASADLPSLDRETRLRMAREAGFRYSPEQKKRVHLAEAGFAALLLTVLVSAQFTPPGSALYGIHRETVKVKDAIQNNLPLIPHSEDNSQGSESNKDGGTSDDNSSHAAGSSDTSHRSPGGSGGSGSSSGHSSDDSGITPQSAGSTDDHGGLTNSGSSGSGNSSPGTSGSNDSGITGTNIGSTGSSAPTDNTSGRGRNHPED